MTGIDNPVGRGNPYLNYDITMLMLQAFIKKYHVKYEL